MDETYTIYSHKNAYNTILNYLLCMKMYNIFEMNRFENLWTDFFVK